MKVLVVADTMVRSLQDQFDAELVRGVELILSCGDLPPEYLQGLRRRLDRPLFYVKGNHDIRYDAATPQGCENIHRRLVRYQGVRILGLEGSRWYNGGRNQYHDHEMRMFLWRLWFTLKRSRGVDLVLTHAPPRHVHDREDRCHKGFPCFHPFIAKYRPRYFLHGHIHQRFDRDEERVTQIDATRIVNCYGYVLLDI